MNSFFHMNPNDPHNIFFAARMGLFALALGVILALSIIGTLLFLGWKEHRRYMKQREEKRRQHVLDLMNAQKQRDDDRLLHSNQSCIVTLPDAEGIMRQIQTELMNDFR
jgi:hypothetical protein